MNPIPITPMVKRLIITNVVIWLVLQIFIERMMGFPLTHWVALFPEMVLQKFMIWQLFTYQFFHSVSVDSFTHLLFNMLMLWFFGSELENRWGKKYFLFYYLMTGLMAGLIYSLGVGAYAMVTGVDLAMRVPVIGASGAIFGLLLAHGLLFSERIVYFFMIFPMKNKVFVMLMGLIQIGSMLSSSFAGSGVAYLCHLGGLISGYILLKLRPLGRNWGKTGSVGLRSQTQRKGNLRLVVDNEKKDHDKPKYWN